VRLHYADDSGIDPWKHCFGTVGVEPQKRRDPGDLGSADEMLE
jgi:hypothetical protein